MSYQVLATDYDGTLACHGRVDDATIAALHRARDAGLRLVMVTGRELGDLFNNFEHDHLFDRIVAENGAIVYDPSSKTMETLATPPPPSLLEDLTRRSVPFSAGHVIVATVEPYEHQLLEAIRELGIEWHVIFNKGAVMALPANVTKATGLSPTFRALGIGPEQTVGVGDAENDHAFLRACGVGVAVSNALPALKEQADLVTMGGCGRGVAELIDRIIAGELDGIAPERRKHV